MAPGRYWTPEPLAALTFVEPGGQLLVGTLRFRDLVFRRLDEWTHDTQHLGDSPPPQDGTDIQCYFDRAKRRIQWDTEQNRRINVGELIGPEVRAIPAASGFTAYRLVSERAQASMSIVCRFDYSDELIAAVLTASGPRHRPDTEGGT
ncbi:MAG: hypothetical protein OXO52_22295 [Rhodospirillales bacterium]|nr:hypothetical protein [Rhodospirillales bacterium]